MEKTVLQIHFCMLKYNCIHIRNRFSPVRISHREIGGYFLVKTPYIWNLYYLLTIYSFYFRLTIYLKNFFVIFYFTFENGGYPGCTKA